ncbi:TetR-like C-terminal domain-containing protein [Gordonia shandongensis]|uniref:TetR-like C-terminal domain-containing protein n=1 Tax=Gordonia shandongensis TaxID=376351 RepID=UPI0024809E75|nr:TetR-like C-terminal domain-containing protein [Gordonia shandongensis]
MRATICGPSRCSCSRAGGVIVERGEVAADTDPRMVLEMAASSIYFRVLFTDDPVDADLIAHIARRTIRAFT